MSAVSRFLAALVLLSLLAVPVRAQTDRQRDIRDHWEDPDASRPRGRELLRTAMIVAHNRARAAAGVPAIAWSQELADDSAVYARELARSRLFRHSLKGSRPGPQGENLWMGTADAFAYAEMADAWVKEKRYYRPRAFPDVSSTGAWADVGHYTQIIWRTTTMVGCALASSESDDYLVCRYAPAGNVFGRLATAQQ